MLFCDACDKGYHMTCHEPAIEDKPQGKFRSNRLCNDKNRPLCYGQFAKIQFYLTEIKVMTKTKPMPLLQGNGSVRPVKTPNPWMPLWRLMTSMIQQTRAEVCKPSVA